MTHPLNNWKPYLSNEDFMYLINFVENIKVNLPNNKIIILSGKRGRNGKSTLLNEISLYLGKENVISCDSNGSAFLQPIVKLIQVADIERYNIKYVQQLVNTIQYKQSVISDTNYITKVDKKILDNSKIIQMNHVFDI